MPSLLFLLLTGGLLPLITARKPLGSPPPVPGNVPFFKPIGAGGAAAFTVASSPRFHNRPLYGPHNSVLVLTGDRPITHLSDDHTFFGGLLIGVVRGGAALWIHDADNITSIYSPGRMLWHVSDSRLPGVALSLCAIPAAAGKGFVMDANVTDSVGSGASIVWAFGCGVTTTGQNIGWQLDPLINPSTTLPWDFSPRDCIGNRIGALSPNGTEFSFSFASGAQEVRVSLTTTATATAPLTVIDAAQWGNITNLTRVGDIISWGEGKRSSLAPLPVEGATLWLRAASLASHVADGASVASWQDESGNRVTLTQASPVLQPRFHANGLASGVPAVVFDGVASFLASANSTVGSASTIFALFRDDGSSGGDGCCSGVVFFGDPKTAGGCNGIATLPAMAAADDDDHNAEAGTAIVTKLDYAGSDANGHTNIRGRIVIATSLYEEGGPSTSYVDGCVQSTRSLGGTPGVGVMLGARGNELRRFFRGAISEVLVFPRALNASELASVHAYFATSYPSMPVKKQCSPSGPLTVGRSALLPTAPTRFTWSIAGGNAPLPPTSGTPLDVLSAANARVIGLTRTTSTTPEPLIDAALLSLGPAVDGLFRDAPPAFVHGAMAWDTLYVGWRSEYGATCLGRPELVALEGAFFFQHQDTTSPADAPCVSDPQYLLTKEAPSSRFYGRGRITASQGMYDMQSQLFDQQVHMWRSTGNVTHEALLRPALTLHAEWASDCFDSDRDGLYASYINTWPTDSVWMNGGETAEESSYVYTAQLALRDMALRAGDAAAAARADASAALTRVNFQTLWLPQRGHPAAFREEGGHRRLRPDAWLYSIFLPIEAGLLTLEQGAQALHYTEWGLERDGIACDDAQSNYTCGEVVWTSNWVPSQWSVRQLWSGDVSALILAYQLVGLHDDAYRVLFGSLHRDMLQSVVPGQVGGTNGGTDFNDCVHPLTRTLVEGLFGYRPDYISGRVIIAPQFPSSWPTASFDGAAMRLNFSLVVKNGGAALMTLSVQLTQAVRTLELRVPVYADTVGAVSLTGLPAGATWDFEVTGGFGESIVRITANASSATGAILISGASALVPSTGALPHNATIHATGIVGELLSLAPPAGLTLTSFSDPQGVFVNGTAHIDGATGALTGTIDASAAADPLSGASAAQEHLVFGYAHTAGGAALAQIILFKLSISAAPPAVEVPPPRTGAAAQWAFAPVEGNGDVTAIFTPGTYLSPRPQTCGVRIGSDGYSAWTFPYFHISPTPPTFSNVANLSIGGGVIATPQGAHFLLPNATGGTRNILFASIWDNYPASVNVSVSPTLLPGATTAWVLLAGSTNPMQTLLANAVLRFHYDSGAVDTLELIPPLTFWALSGWGGSGGGSTGQGGDGDYDYSTDAFALPATPPPTVQLGVANRAMVYAQTLRHGAGENLHYIELEALSQEVVVGVLAVSLSA